MPTVSTLPARRLEPADLGWATAMLETACAHHPVLDYCCSEPNARAKRQWMLLHLLQFGLRYGRVYTNAGRTALAVWLGPGHPAASWWQLLRVGLLPAGLWRLRLRGWLRLRRFLATTAWLRRQSVATSGHYYLLALAVAPNQRGQGQGRRLVQASMAALQATRASCYLDTQVPEQLPFFRRLGFQLVGQCPAGFGVGAPTNWGLVREAMPAST